MGSTWRSDGSSHFEEFETFGLQNFSKLAKFHELYKTMCKE